MNWRVTYRGKDGNQSSFCIEASTRTEAFKILSERGISPIRIEESKSESTNAIGPARNKLQHLAWLCAGVLCVVGVVFFATRKSTTDSPEKKPVTTRKIAKVQPAKTASVSNDMPVATSKEPKPVDPNARPEKVGEIVNNYIKLPSGRLHYIKGEVTNSSTNVKRDWFEVFDHGCDNEIACLLTLEPGETLVGTPVYRGRFAKEFIKSLESPIIPTADDPQEIKDLKRAVTEAKIELKAAYDRGEDIERIMLETRNQMQDLAAYRQALESELRTAVKDVESEQELDAFVAAANEMLAKKGIAPTELNLLSRKRLQLMINSKKGKRKQ